MAGGLSPLLDAYREACASICTTIEPLALKFVDTMTNNTLELPRNSSSVGMKLPFSQTRRMACTHLTIRRYYGDMRCPICRREPDLGYVYLCTQDEEQEPFGETTAGLTEPDESMVISSLPETDETNGNDIQPWTSLSAWVKKAITKGEYTPEQVTTLRAQKQKVIDTIMAALDQPKDNNNVETSKATTRSPSSNTKHFLPFPVITEANDLPTTPPSPLPKPKPTEKPSTRLFPFCEFRACQTCRPTFRDRAWQSFESIFAKPSAPSIDFANDNRPLSSPCIINNINVARPYLRPFDTFSLYRTDRPPAKRNLPTTAASHRPRMSGSSDIADQRIIEPESRGFRDSVKRAFRGMLVTRRDSVASRRSGRTSRLAMNRRMRLREEEESTLDFDMDLWKELNENLLRVASNVRLPGCDGMDGLEAEAKTGEVEVGDGVAVMEESVGMGTADVIMAV